MYMPQCVEPQEKLFPLNIRTLDFSELLSFKIISENDAKGKVQRVMK